MHKLALAAVIALSSTALAQAAEENVTIEGKDRPIPATITLPDGEGPFPFVVMFHGTGSNRHEAGNGYDLLAPKLAEAGIASARFDFAGSGDSTVDYIEYTPSSGMQDGLDVVAYMRGLDAIANDRLGLLGWSQGGTIAMLTAARTPDVKSLATWAGVLDMSYFAADQYDDAKANGSTKLTFDWRDPLNLSIEWFDEVRALDLTTELGIYKGALLAINGSVDDVVLPEVADDIVAAGGGDNKQKRIIEGADHTYNIFTGDMTQFNELIDVTVSWFKDTL